MSKIAIHHVGGRWGNHPFPISPRFEDDFVVVLYEADTEAIAGIYDACAGRRTELIVQPFCLAAARGDATLHLYSNPVLNSLSPLGTTLDKRYLHLFGVDFDFDEHVFGYVLCVELGEEVSGGLDGSGGREVFFGGQGEVVVFDEDGVEQAGAMVAATAAVDGVLFESAPARCCFAGVVNVCGGAFNAADILARERSDST